MSELAIGLCMDACAGIPDGCRTSISVYRGKRFISVQVTRMGRVIRDGTTTVEPVRFELDPIRWRRSRRLGPQRPSAHFARRWMRPPCRSIEQTKREVQA